MCGVALSVSHQSEGIADALRCLIVDGSKVQRDVALVGLQRQRVHALYVPPLAHLLLTSYLRPLASYLQACQHHLWLIGLSLHLVCRRQEGAVVESEYPGVVVHHQRSRLAEAIVGIEVVCVQLAVLRRTVYDAYQMRAYDGAAPVGHGGHRHDDVRGQHVVLHRIVTEGQLLFQQVSVLYEVHAAALRTDVHSSVVCLYDIHHATATQALCPVSLALVQSEDHTVCLWLQTADDESFGRCCQQHLLLLFHHEVTHALRCILRIALGHHELRIGSLRLLRVTESASQCCHPQASLPVFQYVIDVQVGQLRQVVNVERASRRLFQSVDALRLGAQPQRAVLALIHAVDDGTKAGVLLVQPAVGSQVA